MSKASNGVSVVERVAGGEHQPAEPPGVARRDHLCDSGAAVVADQSDIADVQRVQEVGDQAPKACRRQVGIRPHRGRVRAERQIRDQAAELVLEQVHDRVPKAGAHEIAVEEHDRRAIAGFLVVQGAVRQFDLGHGSS